MALENRRFLRSCRRHLRVSGAGRQEGGDLRLQLERASLRGRSSPCSPFSSSARRRRLPPAPSLRSAARGGERKERQGAAEAGGGPRVRSQLRPDPRVSAPRALPGPAWAAAAAAPGRGAGRGGGGRAAGAGPAVPALTCGARLLPTWFFPPGSRDPASRRRPPSRRTRTPWVRRTRVPWSRKLFLRTRVGAAVAGSQGSDLSSACGARPARYQR